MGTDVLEHSPDGDGAFADATAAALPTPSPRPAFYRLALTALIAFGPPITAAIVLWQSIGNAVPWFELALAAIFLAVIGHGVTIGYHRLFTHRAFDAARPLKITLALLGSMSFQGSVIGWVADHRRHHRYVDQPHDPHSPVWIGSQPAGGWRGLFHAHVGWCFRGEATSRADYAPDLLADRDLVLIDHLFVPCCIATLALPFAIGYAWTGTLAGALGAFLFAGVIRVGFSHNVTWSVNSVCHRFGKRVFRTRDVSTNFAPLAALTMGESWHNNHHAFPRLARHGVDRGQIDSSAFVIRLFERLGWVTNVQWPDRARLDARRLPC